MRVLTQFRERLAYSSAHIINQEGIIIVFIEIILNKAARHIEFCIKILGSVFC